MFVFEDSCLKYREYMVVADLHIGYEAELEKKGYSIPSQTKEILEKIKNLKKDSKKIILLGDVKHEIPKTSKQEIIEIPFFLRKLKSMFEEVVIIKGNHDGNIEKMTDLPVLKEFVLGEVGFVHGNSLPSKDFLEKVKIIVMGHTHPVFKYEDDFGKIHFKKSWVIGKWKNKKVIIMPAFNDLFSGHDKILGPFSKDFEKEQIFLTDLTRIL